MQAEIMNAMANEGDVDNERRFSYRRLLQALASEE